MTKAMVMLTSGEYSDYRIHGVILCPSGAWLNDQIAQWKTEHPALWRPCSDRGFYNMNSARVDFDAFTRWLLTLPECEEAIYTESHLGSYHTWHGEEWSVDELPPNAQLWQPKKDESTP